MRALPLLWQPCNKQVVIGGCVSRHGAPAPGHGGRQCRRSRRLPSVAPVLSTAATPAAIPVCLQRKIREDPEISNAVAGGIAGEAVQPMDCCGHLPRMPSGAALPLHHGRREGGRSMEALRRICPALLERRCHLRKPVPPVRCAPPTSTRPAAPSAPPHPAAAGAITATVVCPLDVLKTRLQVQGKAGAAMYRGVGGEYLIKALHPPPNPAPAAAACQLGAASGAARLAAASQYSYEAVAQGEHPAPEP